MPPRLYIDALLAEFDGVGTDGVSPVSFSLLENHIVGWIVGTGNIALRNDAWFIPDVCRNPSSIWQGLRRSGQETTLVYAGVPDGTFAAEYGMEVGFDGDIAIPSDKLFLVFLTHDFRVAKFRFEQHDPSNHSFPIDYAARFDRQLWPLQTNLLSS